MLQASCDDSVSRTHAKLKSWPTVNKSVPKNKPWDELKSPVRREGMVLVVSQDVDHLHLLSKILEKHGYDICTAMNGAGMFMVMGQILPDVILLDALVSSLEGDKISQVLKSTLRTKNIPVIVLGTLETGFDQVSAFQQGADDYVERPFQTLELFVRLDRHIHLSQQHKWLWQENMALKRKLEECDRLFQHYEQTQRTLEAHNTQLTQANQQLREFVATVAHDLQEPLQSVTGLTELVQAKYQTHLDPQAAQYLEAVRLTGTQIQQWMQDLLVYAELESSEQPLVPVDCEQVLQQVLRNLQGAIAQKNALINAAPLPTVMGHPAQLMQLWQNLLSNALKFVHPEVSPHITLTVESQGAFWKFGIHDNGIGLNPQDCDRLFEPFGRGLQTQSYPGNGLGLAICKRIIERHQGQLWPECPSGSGTTFYFTLLSQP